MSTSAAVALWILALANAFQFVTSMISWRMNLRRTRRIDAENRQQQNENTARWKLERAEDNLRLDAAQASYFKATEEMLKRFVVEQVAALRGTKTS